MKTETFEVTVTRVTHLPVVFTIDCDCVNELAETIVATFNGNYIAVISDSTGNPVITVEPRNNGNYELRNQFKTNPVEFAENAIADCVAESVTEYRTNDNWESVNVPNPRLSAIRNRFGDLIVWETGYSALSAECVSGDILIGEAINIVSDWEKQNGIRECSESYYRDWIENDGYRFAGIQYRTRHFAIVSILVYWSTADGGNTNADAIEHLNQSAECLHSLISADFPALEAWFTVSGIADAIPDAINAIANYVAETRTQYINPVIQTGTVSHGTMNPIDLVPVFADLLAELSGNNPESPESGLLHDCHKYRNGLINRVNDSDFDETESELVNDLFDALNEYAPDGFYFGAHCGDGSDYGFWQVEPGNPIIAGYSVESHNLPVGICESEILEPVIAKPDTYGTDWIGELQFKCKFTNQTETFTAFGCNELNAIAECRYWFADSSIVNDRHKDWISRVYNELLITESQPRYNRFNHILECVGETGLSKSEMTELAILCLVRADRIVYSGCADNFGDLIECSIDSPIVSDWVQSGIYGNREIDFSCGTPNDILIWYPETETDGIAETRTDYLRYKDLPDGFDCDWFEPGRYYIVEPVSNAIVLKHGYSRTMATLFRKLLRLSGGGHTVFEVYCFGGDLDNKHLTIETDDNGIPQNPFMFDSTLPESTFTDSVEETRKRYHSGGLSGVGLFLHKLTGELQSMIGATLYIVFLLVLSAMSEPALAAIAGFIGLPNLFDDNNGDNSDIDCESANNVINSFGDYDLPECDYIADCDSTDIDGIAESGSNYRVQTNRKIELDMLYAIHLCRDWKKGNTQVICPHTYPAESPIQWLVTLHGNTIAKHELGTDSIEFSFCGWETRTTRSRLNAILQFHNAGCVFQTNHNQYIKTRNADIYKLSANLTYRVNLESGNISYIPAFAKHWRNLDWQDRNTIDYANETNPMVPVNPNPNRDYPVYQIAESVAEYNPAETNPTYNPKHWDSRLNCYSDIANDIWVDVTVRPVWNSKYIISGDYHNRPNRVKSFAEYRKCSNTFRYIVEPGTNALGDCLEANCLDTGNRFTTGITLTGLVESVLIRIVSNMLGTNYPGALSAGFGFRTVGDKINWPIPADTNAIAETPETYQTQSNMDLQTALRVIENHLQETAIDGNRIAESTNYNNPDIVTNYIRAKIGNSEREHFLVMFLNTRLRLIKSEIMFSGSNNGSQVDKREVIKQALANNADSIILAHNHPSGIVEPSKSDIHITNVLQAGFETVGLRLLDHIIVSPGNATYSFAQNRLL